MFEKLDDDIICEIFSFIVSPFDSNIYSLSLACKHFLSVIRHHKAFFEFWKIMYVRMSHTKRWYGCWLEQRHRDSYYSNISYLEVRNICRKKYGECMDPVHRLTQHYVNKEYMTPEKSRDLAKEVLHIAYKTRYQKYTKTSEKKRLELVKRLAELDFRKNLHSQLQHSYTKKIKKSHYQQKHDG